MVAGPIRCADAGFDLVHVHRIGPDLRGFLDFSRAKVPPRSQARCPGAPVTPGGPVTR
ncbi:hypothetical protein [Streptomyces hirsutus]|uniref:hypothetical protein n=1 Tax=Streptomyces hirsutus TaxID=35620 RepID=UPI000A7B84D3|nr:hypothetical protein [Streptomyces hirsutus]